ncbi:plasmid mobilization protein [Roseivivax sp. CAU 1761]
MPTGRTKRFTIWVSKTERERLHARARNHGITAADLVRAAVLGPNATKALPSRDLLASAVRQAAGAAKNLNQVARRVNEGAKAGHLDARNASAAIDELRKMYEPIVRALDEMQAELVRIRRPRR